MTWVYHTYIKLVTDRGEGRLVDGHGESSDAVDPKSSVGHVYRWYMMGRRYGRLLERREKG
jgi:hypothetical protein